MKFRFHFVREWLVSAASVTALLLFCATGALGASRDVCLSIRELLNYRGGLNPYELEAANDQQGNSHIPNIDVDGDGEIDQVFWSCPRSGSLVPADPCRLSIKLSTGKNIEFSESRFSLIQYGGNIYALTIEMNADGTISKRKLYKVNGSGVSLTCSKL